MKRKTKLERMAMFAVSACLLTTLVSCGSDDDDNDSRPPQTEEQRQEGTFRAVLNPENASVTNATGTAQVRIQGDEMSVDVVMANAPSGTHIQHIHSGTRCPTAADDTNGDGVIDAAEATAVYGPPILPLDSALDSNGGSFPSGSAYSYNEDDSLSRILSNLNLQTLLVEGLVVNVHGVPESTDLPATVQGSKADFPIACGTLTRTGDADAATAAAAAAAAAATAASSDTTSSSTGGTDASTATSATSATDATAATDASTATSATSATSSDSTGTTGGTPY